MMVLPVERWYKSIALRHSRRKYIAQPVNREILESLQKTIAEFTPFADARAVVVAQPLDDIFRGIVGSYGKVKGTRAYMAFIGQTNSPSVYEHVGYLGEGLVLEAVSLGLGTCWISGSFSPETVGRDIQLAAEEKVLAVTPLGYPSKGKNVTEKLMSAMVGSYKRKDLAKISVVDLHPLPAWIETALQAARVAPSAINRQPWVFHVSQAGITLAIDKPNHEASFSKRLDCGIAMLHFELGANLAGVKGHWEYLDHSGVARFVVE